MNVRENATRSLRTLPEYMQASHCPLSVQVTNMQDWTHQSEQWRQSSTVTLQGGCKKIPFAHLNAEDLYLKQGLATLSAKVASEKGSATESTKSTTHHHESSSNGCSSE
ncbi:nuclear factor interleukin-3-regulated protein-like [Stegastes partitus]|uniref:Nuclear factor interleukin-3-regulated protein-like n=1 Tax=Stegastes partitus TaxID=144197 RepID=A0A9Y4KC46_9TELE|nr:PREDICTED: nuclear factor interleukin-3-regulated protein-like [Stegastes partitus]